jgi:hypothetical protein
VWSALVGDEVALIVGKVKKRLGHERWQLWLEPFLAKSPVVSCDASIGIRTPLSLALLNGKKGSQTMTHAALLFDLPEFRLQSKMV